MNDRFSKGNRKMSKNVLIWNLPIRVTCPGAGICKKWCYENKIEKMYKQTVPFRHKNWELSKRTDFVDKVVEYLHGRKEPFLRIHEAGDFYNQCYLDKWKEICRQVPDKNFFCFTKSLHLDLWTYLPKNMQIMQSFGGRWDDRIDWRHATNRAMVHGEKPRKDETWCSNFDCGDSCVQCIMDKKIHLVNYIHP